MHSTLQYASYYSICDDLGPISGISQVKAEIQALSSFGFQYLSKEFLPRKLKEADWI